MASNGCIPFALLVAVFLISIADSNGIQGGVLAPIEDFPFQAFVMTSHVFSCSATILNEEWVVTAAQCASGLIVGESIVGVGVAFYLTNVNLNQTFQHTITEVIPHPNYDEFTKENDIALLRLENHINFTSGPMEPIDHIASENEQFPPGSRASWLDGVKFTLWSTNVTIVSQEQCSFALSRYGPLADSTICASGFNGDTCYGDAGAGMVVRGKLIGITSWGIGCLNPLYPGVYTRISDPGVRSFITTHTTL